MAIPRAPKLGFTLIELMIVVAIVGVLAVLAVYGVRKYIANAKTAEAKNAVAQMAKLALARYESETLPNTVLTVGQTTGVLRDVCLSASAKVPIFVPKAQKYQSTSAEWVVDSASVPPKGFACLRFEMVESQYYQYDYTGVSKTSFSTIARGDLNGNGITSLFRQDGSVINGRLRVAPALVEIGAEE